MSNVKEDVVNELHKPVRRNFKRRKVIIKGLNDLWQSDLIEMLPYSKLNNGHRYVLVVIDTFSKYVWCLPLKSKTVKNVSEAMQKIFYIAKTTPKNLHTDRGNEFFGGIFQNLMKKYNINHYSTFSNLKASIVERVNRTLKNKMWKQFSMQGSYKWLDILPKIVFDYNNTIHSTTGLKPIDVNRKNEKQLLKNVFKGIKIVDPRTPKFKIGDSVRISKYREFFSKGYTPNYSNEIFTINKVNMTNPTTYILEDEQKNEIQGGFYQEELQAVKHPDVYLVEKVLRRKGNKVYVKWLGMKSKNWILKNALL